MPGNDATTPVGWEQLSPAETRRGIRQAAREMGGLVRSTLGPLGVDKMVVRRMQDDTIRTFVSNDGVAILEEFEGETDHPIANRFIALAEDHEDALGDGTTTTTLLTSELLATGIDLIEEGVPPTAVVEGFSIGAQRTLEVWDELAIPVAESDRPTVRSAFDRARLERIARGGMTNGRAGAWPLAGLAEDVVDAVLRVWEPRRGTVHLGYVAIETFPGGDVTDSELIPGTLLPYDPMTADDRLPVEGGVLLIDGDLQPRELRSGSVAIDGARAGAVDEFDTESARIAEAIARSGVEAAFVTGDASAAIGDRLAERGVVTVRNVKRSDIDVLSRVTGATSRGPVTPNNPPLDAELGVGSVGWREATGGKRWLEVTAPAGSEPRSVGLVVRGGTESSAGEAERRIKDGLNAVRAAIKRPAALPGGGAADLAAARAVRELAPKFDGREQLAVEGFAEAMEVVPRTLARNAGRDPIDSMTDLRVRHDAGRSRAGIDADGRLVDDVVAASDALNAHLVRTGGLIRGVEFANSLFTVDGVVFNDGPPVPFGDDGQ
ncbi:TCP-1/cpn60 chaperonin family protein [Halalkalicoccus tibetensis]|uniref:TCP-1/cpn60 chaperonin family protein n=1 Tax=Halalkalicoccus tibetensis TaxID=175632 RepID=A0ABD5V4W4_9EURY